jgi:hypothetical protein
LRFEERNSIAIFGFLIQYKVSTKIYKLGLPPTAVMKRTDKDTLSDINDAPDLQYLVQDKRSTKRATSTKGNRRNRRYENRLLNAQVQEDFDDREEILVVEDNDKYQK